MAAVELGGEPTSTNDIDTSLAIDIIIMEP
jgi:hypothetical protein